MPHHVEGPLSTERQGHTGPPMAFVHPNPTDHDVWIYQQAHFSTWARAISVDLPGYGRSPHCTPGVTMAEIADACWEAVDAVAGGDESAILVGCSVGYAVVLHMARRQPGRTGAILLSNRAGRIILSTDVPSASPMPEPRDTTTTQRAIASGRIEISDMFLSPFTNRPTSSIADTEPTSLFTVITLTTATSEHESSADARASRSTSHSSGTRPTSRPSSRSPTRSTRTRAAPTWSGSARR